MIILERDSTMSMAFCDIRKDTVFYWAGWHWIKVSDSQAASYDNAAQKITGTPMVFASHVMVKVI